jgi:hypothetical protein
MDVIANQLREMTFGKIFEVPGAKVAAVTLSPIEALVDNIDLLSSTGCLS